MRFPGLISAVTVPSGGTSDYAPEMIHAAARGEPYACFVRPDTRIPFMAMPDAIDALLELAAAPRERLTRTAYNLAAFNPTAQEIRDVVVAGVSRARAITWQTDDKRQAIVDSWPEDVDDSRGATRLGLRAALRFRARVRRISDPDDPGAVSDEWTSAYALASRRALAAIATSHARGERLDERARRAVRASSCWPSASTTPTTWTRTTVRRSGGRRPRRRSVPLAEIDREARGARSRRSPRAQPPAPADELIAAAASVPGAAARGAARTRVRC